MSAILEGKVNAFNGVEVHPDALPACARTFGRLLPVSLTAWQADGRQLVWLQVPLDKAALIPIAIGHGFAFHHSQPQYTMLTCALVPETFVPAYATHCIGVGGMVLDADANLLVVNERFRPDPARPFWKLPGGYLDPQEHLVAGVQREIREETGIETAFQHLVGLWHGHGQRFGKSVIYMIFRLRPQTFAIRKCEQEIEDCRWMPVADYLASTDVSAFNRAIVSAGLAAPTLQATGMPGYPRPERHEFFFPVPQQPRAGRDLT